MMISIQDQIKSMNIWPQFHHRPVKIGNIYVEWFGLLKPFDFAIEYTVQVKYILGKQPKVYLYYPNNFDKLPHSYNDGSLCLYYPEDKKSMIWSSDKFISQTIIPWTALWIGCFDVWKREKVWPALEAPHQLGNK